MEHQFKPHQPVFVRNDNKYVWIAEHFSHYQKSDVYPFVCAGGAAYQQCIPAEGNEHLAGTTITNSVTMPEHDFKYGDKVEVRNGNRDRWIRAVFLKFTNNAKVPFLVKTAFCDKLGFSQCRHAYWKFF